MLGKEHREPFVVANPAGIVISAIREMGRQQSEQSVIVQRSLKWFKLNFLQYDIAIGVREDLLVDAIFAGNFGIDQLEYRNSQLKRPIFERAMPFLFRKIILAVGHDEAHVASAGLIHAGKIDFVENAVAQREPNFTVLVQSGSGTGLGAGSPARWNARPTGRRTEFSHEALFLESCVPTPI